MLPPTRVLFHQQLSRRVSHTQWRQAALRFVLDTAGATSAIPGAKGRAQFVEDCGGGVPPLTSAERVRAGAIADARERL